jgi:hypothetical protein
MRKWKNRIAIADICKLGRKIGQPVGEKMHSVPFPLDTVISASEHRVVIVRGCSRNGLHHIPVLDELAINNAQDGHNVNRL